jgi:hypothetical protein
MGVKVCILIKAKAFGRCPSLAPTNTSLEAAKMDPFNDPKVEEATKRGMIQAIGPRIRSPKDCHVGKKPNNMFRTVYVLFHFQLKFYYNVSYHCHSTRFQNFVFTEHDKVSDIG